MKILNTIEEVRAVLQAQLDAAVPNDGDYLCGKSYEDVKQMQINLGATSEEAEDRLKAKIQEWQEHIGDKGLYVMIRKELESEGSFRRHELRIERIWESDIEQFVGQSYERTTDTEMAMPIFIEN